MPGRPGRPPRFQAVAQRLADSYIDVAADHVAGGLAEGGARARLAGLITTPGLAYVAKTGPFAAGVMISASHTPNQDNGIKIGGHTGFKLPD